jgi:hypothetical protein
VRSEGSAEVQQQLSELAALRVQLAKIEVPKDGGPGSFVSRTREFRYAESVADAIARQADAARAEEAAEGMPLQVLDRANAPEFPSSPRLPMWVLAGACAGFAFAGLWVLLRHRAVMARLDPTFSARVELISTVSRRRP